MPKVKKRQWWKRTWLCISAYTSPILASSFSLVNNNYPYKYLQVEGDQSGSAADGQAGSGTGGGGASAGSSAPAAGDAKASATNDKDFSTFAETTNKLLKEGFEKAIAGALDFFTQSLKKAEVDDGLSTEAKLAQINYFAKLINYFSTNKESIASNPEQSGFFPVYLRALSQNKSNIEADVTFNGKTYSGKLLGETPSNSSSFSSYDGLKIEATKPVTLTVGNKKDSTINSISKKDLEKKVQDYVKAMGAQFQKILFEQADLPPFKKEDLINSNSAIDLKPPAGYTDWNDYIKKHYESRFLDFDLKQNNMENDQKQQPKDQQQDDKKDQPKKDNNDLAPPPPVLDNDTPPANSASAAASKIIKKIPDLYPEYKGQYLVDDSVTSSITNQSAEQLAQIFFFDNPVATRYHYQVMSVKTNSSNQNIATVQINDLLTKASRQYEQIINPNPPPPQYQFLYEAVVGAKRKLFERLYQAMGLDDKIDFSKLNSKVLEDSLNIMLNTAIAQLDARDNKDFIKKQQDLLVHYANYALNPQDSAAPNQAGINSVLPIFDVFILNELRSAAVNIRISDTQYHFYNLLANLSAETNYGYYNAFLRVQSILRNEEGRKYVADKFAKYGADLHVLVNLLHQMQVDSFVASGLAASQTSNLLSWYDQYIKMIKKLNQEFLVIRALVQPERIVDAPAGPTAQQQAAVNDLNFNQLSSLRLAENQPITNPQTAAQWKQYFLTNYQLGEQLLHQSIQPYNQMVWVFGIVFVVFTLMSLVIMSSYYAYARKHQMHKLVNKTLLKMMIITGLSLLGAIGFIATGIILWI